MISQVLKEEDLLKEIQENDQSVESLYKQIAIILAAEGREVLLNPSDRSIISDIDERRMSWTIAIASYGLGRGVAWDIYYENLDFDTMKLEGGLYRHTALLHAIEEDAFGYGVPPYYLDKNKQPVGYSRVMATNPPFYSLEVDSPWISEDPIDPEELKKMVEKSWKRSRERAKPRPKQKPKLVKTDPPEPPESDL